MAKKLVFDLSADEIEIFLEDVNESLQNLENGILDLEQKKDPEMLNAIFRAAHTLKALAGMVGHHQMAELTHTLETIFDELRQAKLMPSQNIADSLLETVDVLKVLRDEIVNQEASGVDVTALLSQLKTLNTTDNEQTTPSSPAEPIPTLHQLTPEQITQTEYLRETGQALFEIEVIASTNSFAPAARLYQAVIALLELGTIIVQDPTLDNLTDDDETIWLILGTQSEQKDIESCLNDIDDLAEFYVQPYMLEEIVSLSESSVPETPANNEQHPAALANYKSSKTVRISVERLDKLMNLVGELVTNRTRLLQIENILQSAYGKGKGVGALSNMMAQFNYVVEQLQEEVMHARMLPIASLFNKFPRLVRNVARPADKMVDLIISGETTELDRAIIEAIGDPLIHILRNAVDHGLETPDVRQKMGKPPTGTIHLKAESTEGQIIISVKDDGKGLNPQKIGQAALRKGMFSEEEIAKMSDDELIELIFQPTLSTASTITETSGRGVGLDVVRTNIEQLSGSVMVTSEMGQGTTFLLTLPLTLALVQTMLVRVQNNLYAIPITGINGALYLAEAHHKTVKGVPAIDWHGAILPLLDLREIFANPNAHAKSSKGIKPSIVLVSWGKHRVGLIVDKIMGQQEIVVKSFSPLLGRLPGLSGATILGDGQIALIVDIPNLINTTLQARRRENYET